MDAFPAFFPLAGRRVVIAGSGEAAEAKARLFEGSPAEVVRIEGADAADPASYEGAALVFVATADDDFAKLAADAARAAHAPVNVADRPQLCDFTTPAVIDRGEVVAAIGTSGGSPMLAALLRQDIEVRMPAGAGRLAALFRQMQEEVRLALPDLARRRAFMRNALTGPAAEAALAGDMPGAADALRAALAGFEAPVGRVDFIDARGPADLITLRAVRALAAADVLVVDEDASAEIVDLARRDAQRLTHAATPVDRVAELAAEGLRVARLVTVAGWRAELETLRALGVEAETAPIAAY